MSLLKIADLSGIKKTIATMCDAKSNGGNEDKTINSGKEKGLYEAAVESISNNTFVFKGQTYTAEGSIFEKEEKEEEKSQNPFDSSKLFQQVYDYQPVTTSVKGNYTSVGSAKGFSNAYDDKILKYANKYGIDPNMVKAIISVESGFNANAKSYTNDYGLMQVNAKYHGVILDVDKNIDKGCQIYSDSLRAFNGDKNKALMGYNMGVAGARKALRNGVDSTNYSRKVMANYDALKNNEKFNITA